VLKSTEGFSRRLTQAQSPPPKLEGLKTPSGNSAGLLQSAPQFPIVKKDITILKDIETFHKAPISGVAILEINEHTKRLMKTQYHLHTLSEMILVTSSFDKVITTYDLRSGERLFSIADAHPESITRLIVLELTSFELNQLCPNNPIYTNKTTCPNIGIITTCAAGYIKTWDMINASCLSVINPPNKAASTTAPAAEGAAAAGNAAAADTAGAIYDILWRSRLVTSGPNNNMYLVRLLFACYQDNTIRVWNWFTSTLVLTIKEDLRICSLDATAFQLSTLQSGSQANHRPGLVTSPTSASTTQLANMKPSIILFGAGDDNVLRIWETMTGKLISQIQTQCRQISCIALAEHVDSEMEPPRDIRTLIADGEQSDVNSPARIEVFDWLTKQRIIYFENAHLYAANSLSFLLNGKDALLFSGSNMLTDSALRVWNIATGKEEKEFKGFSTSWHSLSTHTIAPLNGESRTVMGGFTNDQNSFRICFFALK
jgi:WD40 repeat protein